MKLELLPWLTRTRYPVAMGTMFQETTMPLDVVRATTPVTGARPVSGGGGKGRREGWEERGGKREM